MYLEANYWEAICFVPNKNIKFYGFGLFQNFENKNMKVIV